MKTHIPDFLAKTSPTIFERAGLHAGFIMGEYILSDQTAADFLVPHHTVPGHSLLIFANEHHGAVTLDDERIPKRRVWG